MEGVVLFEVTELAKFVDALFAETQSGGGFSRRFGDSVEPRLQSASQFRGALRLALGYVDELRRVGSQIEELIFDHEALA